VPSYGVRPCSCTVQAASPHCGERSRPKAAATRPRPAQKAHSALSLHTKPDPARDGAPGGLPVPPELPVPCPGTGQAAQTAEGPTVRTCRPQTMAIKTLSRGIRGSPGGFPRAVAHAAAAALAVTAMLAVTWAGPLASARADTAQRAASPTPVKFYIVPPPGNGHADSLFTIAAKTLGDGSLFMEIFNLNKGRLQPNGGRLTDPGLIEPGWILQLPADAVGPGVHFGLLPVVTAPTAGRPSRSAGTGNAIMISGALLALLTAGLALRLIRRRAGPTRRRRPAHARAPGPQAAGGTDSCPTTRLTMPCPYPGRQHSRDRGPGCSPHDAQPSRTHHRDPDPGGQSPAGGSGRAGRASPRGLPHDHDRYMASPSAPAPARGALARSGPPPAGWGPQAAPAAGIQRWAAQPDTTQGPAPHAYPDVDLLQVIATDSPANDREGAPGPGAPSHDILHRPAEQPTAPADPFRAQEPVRLANRALPDADHQAAEIRQQTPAGAAALRQACEWYAAELRSALMEMRAELGRVAAFVAGNLQTIATPTTAPTARPKTQLKAQPAAPRTTKPATRPAEPLPQPAEPATPPAKPARRPRQVRAMRLMVLAMAVPILFGLTAATGELVLHGYGVFVFRSAGTGATQQGPPGPGPSQPPVAHHPHRPGSGRAGPREADPQQDREGHDP
jgi:hypothetical protein